MVTTLLGPTNEPHVRFPRSTTTLTPRLGSATDCDATNKSVLDCLWHVILARNCFTSGVNEWGNALGF